MESDIDLDVCLRLLSLTDAQASELTHSFIGVKFGRHFKTKEKVGLIPLSDENIDAINGYMKAQSIDPEETDIFVSFTTEYDSRIISVPSYVARASVALGSKVTLSYTVL